MKGDEAKNITDLTDELRPEYDMQEFLKSGIRGKYAQCSKEEKPRRIIDVINDIKSFRRARRLDGESLRGVVEEGRE